MGNKILSAWLRGMSFILAVALGCLCSTRAGGAPRVSLIGAGIITNECHAALVDPGIKITDGPVAMAAGSSHSLVLKADGSVVAWGVNYVGVTNVPANLGPAIAIAANAYFSLAVKADGSVVGWGDGSYGVTNIPPGATHDVVSVAAGGYHAWHCETMGR